MVWNNGGKMNTNAWKKFILATIITQIILLAYARLTLDFGRSYRALLAFAMVWDAAVLAVLLAEAIGRRFVSGRRWILLLAILFQLLLYISASGVTDYLETHP
jgi:hypothetical protein